MARPSPLVFRGQVWNGLGMNLPQPVQPHERIQLADILRGFALFGVLAANMSIFSGYDFNWQSWAELEDQVIVLGIEFFITGKFYTLFSFLFGWGMAIQLERAQARGTRFLPVYARRLLILLLIGVFHGLLIWRGDILTAYALFGFALLLFRNRSPRFLVAAAAAALLLAIFITAPIPAAETVRAAYRDQVSRPIERSFGILGREFDPRTSDRYISYTSDSYMDIAGLRSRHYLQDLLGSFYWFGNVFSMFLLGAAFGKARIIHEPREHLPLLHRMLLIGGVLGLAAHLFRLGQSLGSIPHEPDVYEWLGLLGYHLGNPALMLAYVSGLALLLQRHAWKSILAPLAPLGRMALTNYLMQSVICTLIFYGYGLGLYGTTGPTFGLALTLVIYVAQILFSAWWLHRHAYGPAEWLWRKLTYLRFSLLESRELPAQGDVRAGDS